MDEQQQQENEEARRNQKALLRLSPSRLKQEIAASEGRRAADSSSEKSSWPTDLVELVMRRHGFTREKAEAELEKFGA